MSDSNDGAPTYNVLYTYRNATALVGSRKRIPRYFGRRFLSTPVPKTTTAKNVDVHVQTLAVQSVVDLRRLPASKITAEELNAKHVKERIPYIFLRLQQNNLAAATMIRLSELLASAGGIKAPDHPRCQIKTRHSYA